MWPTASNVKAMKRMFLLASLVSCCLLAGGCQTPSGEIPEWPWTDPEPPVTPVDPPTPPAPPADDPNAGIVALGWSNVTSTFGSLPDGIQVYKSPAELQGKKAVAFIAVTSGDFEVWGLEDPELKGSTDPLKTPAQVYEDRAPAVVVNGGYFYTDSGKNYAASLAVNDGRLLSPNINYASQDWVSIYYPTRGAFLGHADGRYEAAWTYYAGPDRHYVYQAPAANAWDAAPLAVPSASFPETAAAFEAQRAIGGGPVLLKGGEIRNTGAEELFSATTDVGYAIDNPRTAIGRTADGKTVLFVCEGRNMTPGVSGFTTAAVAQILKDLGCTEALNLDGGGSSCMLVNGRETIAPSDGKQRAVGSAVMLAPAKAAPEPENPPVTIVGKPRYVWIDAAANFPYFANDPGRIASDLKKIKETGFTDIIVDVRPTEATVLWKSKVAPEAKRLATWHNGTYGYIERTADFDYLQAFIDAGRKLGLRVNAAINTFVGGYHGVYGLENEGPLYRGDIPVSWASVDNDAGGLKSNLDLATGGAVFLSPTNDEVQAYVLALLGELAAYDLDGIILDRCRFDDFGLRSDFSDSARAKFEAWQGAAVTNWPSDIFAPGTTELPSGLTSLQKRWLAFRAKTIHDFVAAAADKVHSVGGDIRFGVYVGAWYSTYYDSGVNWASPRYDTSKYYPWASSDYKDYGFADHCDFMMLGCYAGTTAVYGTTEWTMQGFAKRGRELLCGDTVFAGGPDVGNSPGFENGGAGNIIPSTVDACINAADGYFCFDLCHIRKYDYWDAFKQGFDNYLNTL